MNTNTLQDIGRRNGTTHSFGEKRTRPSSLRLLTIVTLLLMVMVGAVAMHPHWVDWQPTFQQLVNTVADLWEYNRS